MKKEVIYYNTDGSKKVLEYKVPDKFNEKGYLIDGRTKAIKNGYVLLPRELTKAERGDLNDLKTLIKKDQLLVYKSNGVWKPYDTKKIADFLQTTERQAKRLLNKAKKYKVLAEIKINNVKYYMYNPYYERVESRISFIAYLAFQDSDLRNMIEPQYRGMFQKQIEENKGNVKKM